MGGHTPGPWTVTPDSFVMAGSRPSVGVARVITHVQKFPANARLIAAAPDLLEALKDLVRHDRLADERDGMWACVEREAAEDVIAWVEGRAERP